MNGRCRVLAVSGLTITFTANRRIGARGAYVLGSAALVDGRLPEEVPWKMRCTTRPAGRNHD